MTIKRFSIANSEGKIEHKTVDQLYKDLNAKGSGLSQREASARLAKHGANTIKSQNRLIFLRNLAAQFTDFLVIILIIAGILSLLLGDSRTADVMFAVVLLNAAIGFWQQYKTERTLAALKELLPPKSKVLREGKQKEILSKYVVPGDIVILQAGDAIPADGRIIEFYSFKTNESALTGESNPQNKHIHVDERHLHADSVFAGTTVLEGEAKVLITATGVNSEFGKIAEQTKETEQDLSPLQKRLKQVGRTVAIISGSIMVAIIFFELIKVKFIDGQPLEPSFFREIFLFGLGVAAALVPEGLPATVSVALSLGANRLIKKNAVVRKLASVETLGSTEVICTDKTGTLTTGKMEVLKLMIGDEVIDIDQLNPKSKILNSKQIQNPKSKIDNEKLKTLLENFYLCNNVKQTDKGLIGDPNEVAIYQAALNIDVNINKITGFEKVHEFSFNSIRMMMSQIYKYDDKHILFLRGAPNHVIDRCKDTAENKKKYQKVVDDMAGKGLRVLAFGHREVVGDNKNTKLDEVEKDLIFDGLVGIEDKIRPEVPEAIKYCHRAGIRLVMITGDYKLTAESVAKSINLAPENKFRLISGDELNTMKDIELRENLLHPAVFYQTDPRAKLKIVETLQKMGHTVAVTGDGVNDALALKKADIGVAMGKVGTDVAKEAANMVLLDDNFATIVNAVKEGRIIWDNLKKFLFYVFASNFGEFGTIFFGLLFGLVNPILAVQILAVDLGTDVLPSLALAADPAEPDVLSRPAQGKKQALLSWGILKRLSYVGVVMGGGAVLNFWFINGNGAVGSDIYYTGTTAAFATLVVCQIVNVFEVREFSNFGEEFLQNKYLLLSVAAEILILLGVVYFPPLQKFLSTRPLDLVQWSSIIAVGVAFLLFEEIRKHFQVKNMQVKLKP